MFRGFSKLCLYFDKKKIDFASFVSTSIQLPIPLVAVCLLLASHYTHEDYAVMFVIICYSLIFCDLCWSKFFCGHPCLKPKPQRTVDMSAVQTLQGEILKSGIFRYDFSTAFRNTSDELKYIADYTRELIHQHIKDVPMFERVSASRYTGVVQFVNNRINALKWWEYHHTNLNRAAGFHCSASNLSYIYVPGHTYAELVHTVLHERIHSFVLDEAVTEFATLYLLFRFGTPEEKAYAYRRLYQFCDDYSYESYTEYSFCVAYFCKYAYKCFR